MSKIIPSVMSQYTQYFYLGHSDKQETEGELVVVSKLLCFYSTED